MLSLISSSTDVGTLKERKMVAETEHDELLDLVSLADPDSCFREFRGVHIHHKVYDPYGPVVEEDAQFLQERTLKIGFAMILLHGFGASVYSWSRVMRPLARLIGSKALAFDRPAFGLTSRNLHAFGSNDPKPLNPYSMAFSVRATLNFASLLAAEKVILVGHSAGSFVAVDTYFQAPERVAALILVAPAILAPLYANNVGEGNGQRKQDQAMDSTDAESPCTKFFGPAIQSEKRIIQAITVIIRGIASMLGSLCNKALTAFLRSAIGVMLVRLAIENLGVTAVRKAWYDRKQVTEQIIHGYTKPLKAKGWDRALVEFFVAVIADFGSRKKPSLAQRLKDIKCPVLIVTGDTDRIVPAWNAKRLSRAIPGSVMEVIKECGHLPQEEKPEEFISIVAKFLRVAFGGSQQRRTLT